MGTSILRAVLFVAAAATTALAVEGATATPIDSWVIVGDHDSTTMSGDASDVERARAAIPSGSGLWLRRAGHEYVIVDAKVLARAHTLLSPMDELSKQMQPLSRQENAWGKQMSKLTKEPERNRIAIEALGEKMEQLGKQMETIGHQMESAAHLAEQKMALLFDEARAANLVRQVDARSAR